MDFLLFDRRGYPVVSVKSGYAEWALALAGKLCAGMEQVGNRGRRFVGLAARGIGV
jgi:hypothetical protein